MTFCRTVQDLAPASKSTLMTGAFNDSFVFEIRDPAAEMGAGAGNGKGLLGIIKENKVALGMIAGQGQGCGNGYITGPGWYFMAEKTEQGIEHGYREGSSCPPQAAVKKISALFLDVGLSRFCRHDICSVRPGGHGLEPGR